MGPDRRERGPAAAVLGSAERVEQLGIGHLAGRGEALQVLGGLAGGGR